ncbi:hypothetical protein [Endozoicomonas acroporae]|uniref:hypothetical protein n=1 Tax=Endozoicomonas acroporae TaxID=1701104 RepID=UPI003D7B8C20
MYDAAIYSYSLLWRFRYLASFMITGLLVFLMIALPQGLDSIGNDPFTPLFITTLMGVGYTYRFWYERKLAKKIIIRGMEVTFENHLGKTIAFSISDIETIEVIGSMKSINGFGINELVLKITGGIECIIPININDYHSMYLALKGEKGGHIST